jgi:hypothetical protein
MEVEMYCQKCMRDSWECSCGERMSPASIAQTKIQMYENMLKAFQNDLRLLQEEKDIAWKKISEERRFQLILKLAGTPIIMWDKEEAFNPIRYADTLVSAADKILAAMKNSNNRLNEVNKEGIQNEEAQIS